MLETDKKIIFKGGRETPAVTELKELAKKKGIKIVDASGEGDLRMIVKGEGYSYRLHNILELQRRIDAMPDVKQELVETLNSIN